MLISNNDSTDRDYTARILGGILKPLCFYSVFWSLITTIDLPIMKSVASLVSGCYLPLS